MVFDTLSPEEETEIKKKINEDPIKLEGDIKHIQEWLSKQPHLPSDIDERIIRSFLRGCKYSLEKTKRKLDFYFTMRTAAPELFTNRDPTSEQTQFWFKKGFMTPMPKLSPEGHRVWVMGIKDCDAKTYDYVQINHTLMYTMDLHLKMDDLRSGEAMIFDFSEFTLSHAVKITLTMAKKLMTCLQEGYPMKMKQIHLIFSPASVQKLISVFMAFTKEKIQKRIHIHGDDLSELHNHIPKKCLPDELGGTAGSLYELDAKWKQLIVDNREWFLEQEDIKSDESRRPEKPKTESDLFGVEGSFRKLELD